MQHVSCQILEHPEYHELLGRETPDETYTPEGGRENPFLHMGLHLAIREQVATNRPTGIAAIHLRLTQMTGDPNQAEHRIIDCLAESLWEAQSRNQPPDEGKYLERLKNLS